jgi:two-component system sensor histidine kinase UhpB
VTAAEWIVLAIGTGLMIAVNVLVVRRVFGPLRRLEATMERIDPLDPGRRIAVAGPDDEIARLARAFNAMLDRLEHERADSGRRALRAQEAERARLARELHDELGQLLTAVVLQLEGLGATVAAERRADFTAIQDAVREGVQTVREIARGLRPPALDEFGLRASLAALAVGFGEHSGVRVRQRIDPDLPAMDSERELAVYRVAQEAMTNVARHAGARNVELALRRRDGAVVLTVRDDGCGIEERDLRSATGVAGMRERALLVGGSLAITGAPAAGTNVELRVPLT